MTKETMAILVFGAIIALAIIMFALERRGIAARKAARRGREVDVSGLIAFGSAAGEGTKTHGTD
ncbi:hypothetical protein [Roseobacter sp.]|uniref:hypothetical protein n=1 Tax=Roseobacter sp. TaxID=1907202 RepID=UPI003296DCA8